MLREVNKKIGNRNEAQSSKVKAQRFYHFVSLFHHSMSFSPYLPITLSPRLLFRGSRGRWLFTPLNNASLLCPVHHAVQGSAVGLGPE